MDTTNQPEAVFRMDSAIRKSNAVWADKEIRLFGELTIGSLSLDDKIRVAVIGGEWVETTIARFTEDFWDDWVGLPFYDTVHAQPRPFCICVDGNPFKQHTIAIPSQVEKCLTN